MESLRPDQMAGLAKENIGIWFSHHRLTHHRRKRGATIRKPLNIALGNG